MDLIITNKLTKIKQIVDIRILNFDFEKIFSEQGAFGGGGAANGGGEGVEGEYVEVESDQDPNIIVKDRPYARSNETLDG